MDTERIPTPVEPAVATADETGGTTWISDAIVAKIAGLAALETDGVAGLRSEGSGRGWGRAPRDTEQATVAVTDGVASVDLRLVVRDGVRIPDVVDAVRARVIERVQQTTGMRVGRVDIGVVDVVIAGDTETETETEEGTITTDTAADEVAE